MKNPELQSCWSWEGCIFWQAVSFRIERIFGICLPEAIRYFAWTNWVIDRVNPGLILATSMAHPRERIIAHAARSRKVPVVVSHHGALGTVYAPIHFYQDINFVDGMLCYGHGVASYVRKYTTRQPALKAVGSPRVARIVREAPSRRAIRRYLGLDVRRPIVIYVPTNMEGNRHYLSYRVPSDTTCYHMHRRIISVLGKHPEYQVVIKRHMDLTSSVIDTWVSRQDWPHVKVISHPPFSWLVNLADTLVVDLPSTVLLETLQTDSAIYLFNNWVKWEGAALDALKKVAFCSDDLDAFCERLDADLVSGKAVQPRPRDEEFLRLVCLPEQDVSSARRAAGAIQDVLKTGCMDWND